MTRTEPDTRPRHPVAIAEPAQLDGAPGGFDDAAAKIREGRAFLKVVAYPWGVDFDLCEVGDEH
jgi:hypothetical protein